MTTPTATAQAWPAAGVPLRDASHPRPARPLGQRQVLGLRAGVAELVLLNRLRARSRPQPANEVLEHAARILAVTSGHWFGRGLPGPGT